MNKLKRIILITILTIIISITTYITFDCIRLRNSSVGTKPLITITEKITENRVVYTGLGYTIKYYINQNKEIINDITLIEQLGYGAEFRLFNKILIWAWVE